jgi:hypothetical protein
VSPHATATGRATTTGGGTLHVLAGERAAMALLPFALRGGLFCHFAGKVVLFDKIPLFSASSSVFQICVNF